MIKRLILIFSIISSSASFADTTNLSGYQACGIFLSDCDDSKMSLGCQGPTLWARGYISGILYRQGIEVSKQSLRQETMKYALINYCRQNPFKDTHDAVEEIYIQIK